MQQVCSWAFRGSNSIDVLSYSTAQPSFKTTRLRSKYLINLIILKYTFKIKMIIFFLNICPNKCSDWYELYSEGIR